jgi:hypothetical protein
MIRLVIAYEAHVVAPVVLSRRSIKVDLGRVRETQRLPSNFTNLAQLNVGATLIGRQESGLDDGLRLGEPII